MSSKHLQPWARGLETLCLKKLKQIGGTGNARELSQALDQPMENISPRLNALARALLIRDTGQRSSVGRGRPLVTWTVTDAGWAVFTGNDITEARERAHDAQPAAQQIGLL